jgi:hypothetical protein
MSRTIDGSGLTWTLNPTLAADQVGSRTIKIAASTNGGLVSDWYTGGTFTIPPIGAGQPDQYLVITRESPGAPDAGDPLTTPMVSISQANANYDTGALSVYHVNDPITIRVRFGKPNTPVWVTRTSFQDGAMFTQTVCTDTIGLVSTAGGCLLGNTDRNGFLEWHGTIYSGFTGLVTAQIYVGAQTPNPSQPAMTDGPMNEDNYVGALVYWVVGLNGLPTRPVW